jgi:enamine deaminase RidA (YjgF/YER057c/UK114 family)
VSPDDRLAALGIEAVAPPAPSGAFVQAVRSGSLLFLSGHIARRDGGPWRGRLGADMTTAQGREAARAVAIDLIGTLRATCGDLTRVARIVKLLVLVNSAPDFTEQHLVANGASELLREVFGDAGVHARSAIGVAQLPLGTCVEIELVAELRDG